MMRPGQVMLVVLAVGCGLLAALAAMIMTGFGQDIEARAPDLTEVSVEGEIDARPFDLKDADVFVMVTERPLFNEDRRPAPLELDGLDDERPEIDQPESPPLNVTVNGIIVTPQLKMAMVTDNTANTTLRLREGMPLDGEQAAWVLASIEPRRLVFEGGGPEAAEVELAVHTQALGGGAPPPRRTPVRTAATNQRGQAVADADTEAGIEETREEMDERARKAEEIRRRVAERRAQLRAEAARRRAQQEQEEE